MNQFIFQILNHHEEHTKLPDLEIAQMDRGLECYVATDNFEFKFGAMAGTTREAINTYSVALFGALSLTR